jgi:hypothetical protein
VATGVPAPCCPNVGPSDVVVAGTGDVACEVARAAEGEPWGLVGDPDFEVLGRGGTNRVPEGVAAQGVGGAAARDVVGSAA